MKLIIAGGRDFNDYDLAERSISFALSNTKELIEIVSGCCDDNKNGVLTFTRSDGTKVYGADGIGERYAKDHSMNVTYFPADWATFGKQAGPIRNRKMARYGTHCIVFWDKISRGSNSMIKEAKEFGLPIKIITY